MNLASKSISSPGRPEKYPSPLLRFLRSNAASKSRKSRSNSPMFIKKNNNDTQQEPTSPKVTCIGQVRSKARTTRVRAKSKGSSCCCWKIKRPKKITSFCPKFGKMKIPRPGCWKPDWKKWCLFLRCGYCRKSEITGDEVKSEEGDDEEVEMRAKVESAEEFVSICPPKNALLLTRCRSAPYRSSSLASRFWAFPETGEITEDFGNEKVNSERVYEQLVKGETEKPILEIVDLERNEENLVSRKSEELEEKLKDLNVIEGLIRRKSEEIEDNLVEFKVFGGVTSRKSEEIEENLKDLKGLISRKSEEIEEKVIKDLNSRKSEEIEEKFMKDLNSRKSEEISQIRNQAVVLMRCKSEPARTGERLNPNLVV